MLIKVISNMRERERQTDRQTDRETDRENTTQVLQIKNCGLSV